MLLLTQSEKRGIKALITTSVDSLWSRTLDVLPVWAGSSDTIPSSVVVGQEAVTQYPAALLLDRKQWHNTQQRCCLLGQPMALWLHIHRNVYKPDEWENRETGHNCLFPVFWQELPSSGTGVHDFSKSHSCRTDRTPGISVLKATALIRQFTCAHTYTHAHAHTVACLCEDGNDLPCILVKLY